MVVDFKAHPILGKTSESTSFASSLLYTPEAWMPAHKAVPAFLRTFFDFQS
jgi:hypothetical protein